MRIRVAVGIPAHWLLIAPTCPIETAGGWLKVDGQSWRGFVRWRNEHGGGVMGAASDATGGRCRDRPMAVAQQCYGYWRTPRGYTRRATPRAVDVLPLTLGHTRDPFGRSVARPCLRAPV